MTASDEPGPVRAVESPVGTLWRAAADGDAEVSLEATLALVARMERDADVRAASGDTPGAQEMYWQY